MKIRLTVLIIVLALTFASCSAPAAQTGDIEKAGFSESDLVFVLDGAEYPLGTDAAPLLAALGDEYELTAAESCKYKGEDKEFYYPSIDEQDIMVATNPIDGKDIFYLIEISGGDYQTAKGVKVGSSLDEVKAAYGDNGFEKDGEYVYSLSGDKEDVRSRRLCFIVDDGGNVTVISFFDPSANIVN